MNREKDFTDALAKGQVIFPDPDRFYLLERRDGAFWAAGEINGVFYLGPYTEVPSGTLPNGARVAGVITPMPRPGGPLSQLKRVFESSEELDGAVANELFDDPDVRLIVELGNLRTLAATEVDAIINGLDEALCLGPDESANLIAIVLENARELHDTLTRWTPAP